MCFVLNYVSNKGSKRILRFAANGTITMVMVAINSERREGQASLFEACIGWVSMWQKK